MDKQLYITFLWRSYITCQLIVSNYRILAAKLNYRFTQYPITLPTVSEPEGDSCKLRASPERGRSMSNHLMTIPHWHPTRHSAHSKLSHETPYESAESATARALLWPCALHVPPSGRRGQGLTFFGQGQHQLMGAYVFE